MIIIKLPVFFMGVPLLLPELTWELTGTKLAEGAVMYKDVIDTLEPLSAGTYYIIALIVDKPHYIYIVLTLLLIFVQAVIFNFIININNLFTERNYLPALLYILLSSLFIDFYTLSPVLLGTTFLILSLHFIFILIRSGDNDENIFYTGVLISIASLFYFPFFVFLFSTIAVFLFFTPAMVRKYFVLLMGFIFPYLLTATYYFLRDGMMEFLYCHSYSLMVDTELLVSIKTLLLTSSLPILFLLAGFATISVAARYINYQYVAIRVLGLWLIFAALSLYFSDTLNPNQLFIFVPVLSFFLCHYFLLVKNKWIRELSFLLFIAVILYGNYKTLYNFSAGKEPEGYKHSIVKKIEHLPFELKDNKVLVLGNDKSYYLGNKLGGPYLNWALSQKFFRDLNNYSNISIIYHELSKDMPEVIIDQEGVVPKLFERIPFFAGKYRKAGDYNIYLLKSN